MVRQEQETADLNGDNFEDVYSDCTDEKFSFMYIDKSSGVPTFYKRFEYLVKLPTKGETTMSEDLKKDDQTKP